MQSENCHDDADVLAQANVDGFMANIAVMDSIRRNAGMMPRQCETSNAKAIIVEQFTRIPVHYGS